MFIEECILLLYVFKLSDVRLAVQFYLRLLKLPLILIWKNISLLKFLLHFEHIYSFYKQDLLHFMHT